MIGRKDKRTKGRADKEEKGNSKDKIKSNKDSGRDKNKDRVADTEKSKYWNYVKLGISVLIFLIIITGLVYGVYWLYEQKVYKDKLDYCLKIQNSDDLKYNCTCVPDMREINKSDELEKRTERMCICSCDIGKEEPYVIEVRKDRKS